MSGFRLSNSSLKHREGVDPRLIEISDRAIQITKVDFGIPQSGGKRTAEQQNALYNEGVSTLDGYNKESYHQSGKALDVFAFVDGKASWETEHLAMVAAAMLQAAAELGYPLQWGGLWTSFVDMPHFQLPEDA